MASFDDYEEDYFEDDDYEEDGDLISGEKNYSYNYDEDDYSYDDEDGFDYDEPGYDEY
ncbi:MAG: hypothetical protein HXK63_06200 [Campylobacter sp.]|nr:hypothetical protein [Campylobacter sp.]